MDPTARARSGRSETVVLHAVPERLRHAGTNGRRVACRGCRREQSSRQPRGIVSSRFRSASAELASATVTDGPPPGQYFLLESKPRLLSRKPAAEGPAVIIDGYPGRAASSVFETFSQQRNGSYRVVFSPETRALAPYEAWSGVSANALGYDLDNAQTIVSFGAPLLDGWGAPGRFTRLWADRAAGNADPQLRLIQVDGSLSRTAARAWRWVPVQADSEAALAAGVARVLLEEHLVSARGPMPSLTLADAAIRTGLTTDAIRDLARTMVARTARCGDRER